jgi:hypothetical protein
VCNFPALDAASNARFDNGNVAATLRSRPRAILACMRRAAGPEPRPLFACGAKRTIAAIARTLVSFGPGAVGYAERRGIRIVPLTPRRRYHEASGALRRLGVDVDGWPVPPAGLFVVEERTVYLRSVSPMTVAHEFGHALDCALGGGIYRSGHDPAIRGAFAAARDFVTPYAATGVDEYFAECLRAYVEVNDPGSPWPPATRERLRGIDPAMHGLLARLFAEDFGANESEGPQC